MKPTAVAALIVVMMVPGVTVMAFACWVFNLVKREAK
jgi:hypothetical protein